MSEYLLCPKCFSNKLDSKSVMQTIPTIKCGDCGSVFDYQYVEEKCKTAPNNFIKKMGKAFANKCLKISQLEKENAELKLSVKMWADNYKDAHDQIEQLKELLLSIYKGEHKWSEIEKIVNQGNRDE